MSEGKYGKYILQEPRLEGFPGFIYEEAKDPVWKDLQFNVKFTPLMPPKWRDFDDPMKHDFPQIFGFFGADPENMWDFDAEIELYLGDEQEKHIINKACLVYIAPGMPHTPLRFKKINKPIWFVEINLTNKYTKRAKEGNGWTETLGTEEIKRRHDARVKKNLAN